MYKIVLIICAVLFAGVSPSATPLPLRHTGDPDAPGFGESTSYSTPAGPAVAGVEVALSKWKHVYRVGSPIWVISELRNVTPGYVALMRLSPSSYAVDLRDVRIGQKFERTPSDRLDAFPGAFAGFGVPQGESHFAAIRIDRLFDIAAAGKYDVQLTVRMHVQPVLFGQAPSATDVVLLSNPLRIDVLPPWTPARGRFGGGPRAYEDAPGNTPAGPPSHGFALSLKADWPNAYVGNPISVTVELRNVAGYVGRAAFGSLGSDYDFRIINKRTGAVVPRDAKATSSRRGSQPPWVERPIYPDTSLYGKFDLAARYRFSESGSYSVRVTGRPIIAGRTVTLESNPIVVTYAAPPRYVALLKGKHILDYAIRTDRLAYTAGQQIFVELTVSNVSETPVAYSLNTAQPPCVIIVTSDRNEHLPSSRGGAGTPPGRGVMVMPRLPPGPTAFPWKRLSTWGYDLEQPGVYVLNAKSNIDGAIFTPSVVYSVDGSNAGDAAPVTIRILSKEAARTEPAATLSNSALYASFQAALVDFRRVRSSLSDYVNQLQRGIMGASLESKSGDWRTDLRDLERRVSNLPISADRNASYMPVQGNLIGALAELGVAGDCGIMWRNVPDTASAIHIADYYFDAVERELANGEARINDTAYPPAQTTESFCAR